MDSKFSVANSPLKKIEADHTGSPVGVVRMDPGQSYAGTGELLQDFIKNANVDTWIKIQAKINYTYQNIDWALTPLTKHTSFDKKIKSRVEKGQKLLFKPNLVSIFCIDPETHGPDSGSTSCTEWPFIAALMRWFHDHLGIRYHQMALGEAATCMPAAAGLYSGINPDGKPITSEGVIEGKAGSFYGGWGFYFARKYLAECLDPNDRDNPMNGHEESVAGTYIPPGCVRDKLMVYDLNRIFDDPSKGREVLVPDGVNFQTITLHKAIVGGDPENSDDLKAYPGCILVNVPKLKVHSIALFTNVIKNLGIGLYPMQFAQGGRCQWNYSAPRNPIPGMKAAIPHQVWVSDVDEESCLPKKDEAGNYLVRKTGGLTATMIDIVKAVDNLGIFMIHVVDGIEMINQDHMGLPLGLKEPEGMVFAGLDPVATDLLCARYMFSNVPLKEALQVGLDDGAGGQFPQKVPIPAVEGQNIVTQTGYDCPLARDICFAEAEKRGLGSRKYYVVGRDVIEDQALISLQGHLGGVKGEIFRDVTTQKLFYDVYKIPWDLQQMAFSYFAAVDQIAGSSLKKEFLEAFDENRDGIVTYEEFGKKGGIDLFLWQAADFISEIGRNPSSYLRSEFLYRSKMLKYGEPSWNIQGHNIMKESAYGVVCMAAHKMSQAELEAPDPFQSGLTWGKGKWPSFQLAWYLYLGISLYGDQFPFKMVFPSLYGFVFRYADLTQNDGKLAGKIRSTPDPEALTRYIVEVTNGQRSPLNFTLYIPAGYDDVAGLKVPNVEVTVDPARILTAAFDGGREVWTAETF
ncbi:MAG TPA: DUF362 domain-containing protein [Thermodesulfobacteriota bacterium]|nr:DUF362 domain-containing protein [Thermodesulfobacteriota bacterium]